MKKRTFPGGVHPPEEKHFTEKKPIEILPPPEIVVVPLQQHIGAPTQPLVSIGQEVKLGEKIAEATGFVSIPVHSPVSGTVKSVKLLPHPVLGQGNAAIIENNGEDTPIEEFQRDDNFLDLPREEMINRIKEAGVAGLGGAAFPTHVKLSPPPDKPIDTVILNGAECEPYLTADHRVMLEHTDEVVAGLKIIMKILGVQRAIIGIENNKPDAIEKMLQATRNDDGIQVMSFPVKYPQGAEKQMIKAALGREVPSGGLPMDVGVIVQNVGTARAIYHAVAFKKPLISRVITVTGSSVNNPANLEVRIGTPFQYILDHCGGLKEDVGKVIMGGPMMGIAQYTLEVPVVKGTSGILALPEHISHLPPEDPCIGCGRCIEVCPMHLLPTTLQMLVEHERFEEADELHVLDCIECGSCSYICPANRRLLPAIRLGKRNVLEMRRKAG